MTMQVKEERVDTDYHRSSGSNPPASSQPMPPLIFPSQGAYPSQITTHGAHPPQNTSHGAYPSQNTTHGAYPQPNTTMMMPNNVQTSKPEDTVSESQIDFSSVKGIFGWTSIDGVDVPYIFRKDKMFVSVRIVEQKLLNKYPNSYPDDLGKHQPLTSFFITPHECKLLNEINQVHCGGEFGTKLFSIKDLIVLLSDFVEFYNLVKKTFPENDTLAADKVKSSECGWLQVNNTVSPYVKRKTDKFVPLSVMKYAAALNIPGTGVLPETEECDLLNKACKIAGFNFSFSKTTRIISLNEIMNSCTIKIMELPMENPLQHAQYIEIPSTNNNNNNSATNNVTEQPPAQPPKSEQNHSKSPGHEMGPNSYHPNMHPSFMDPRMMFSYNRHPYNMYAMQYGPPNVTVNPHQYPPGMFHPGMGPPPPPPYMNGQMPNQPQQGRNPTPEGRPSQSPVRSPSNGSANSTPQPKSPGRLTSPNQQMNQYPQMRPQLSPGAYGHVPMSQGVPVAANRPPGVPGQQSHPMPPGHNMMYPNPMANFMQHRGQFMGPHMRPNMLNNPQHMRPGMPNNNQAQQQRTAGPSSNSNMKPNSQQTTKSQSGPTKQMRPPPSMSGPHQGPMNALQSMVSHQNGRMRPPIPQVSNIAQRNMSNGLHSNIPRSSAPQQNVTNNSQVSSVRQAPPNTGLGRHEPHGHVTNGNNSSRQTEKVSNVPTENKGSDKCINQVLVESIKGVWLGGKSISCMHLDCPGRTGKFCLVEAVCKLYFSGCSVNEFLYALENVLKVPLMTCTDDEEKAFIHYYSLPVTVLKCNKMIDFEDLEKFFPQLSYVFKEKTGNGTPHKTLSQSTDEEGSLSAKQLSPQFPAMPMTMSEMQQQSNKRSNEASINGPPPKSSKRLEDTVQRLMHQQGMSSSGCANSEKPSTGGAIIILDD